ncbi:glycosyltransferase family 4 protein [Chloroflexota bacterium]
MKILYSLPHPADTLQSEQAGHTVRARAILTALEKLGNEIVMVEAAADQQTQKAVSTYRGLVKKFIPRPLAMRMRDAARIAYGRRYAARLLAAIEQHQPDVILETHIAFSEAGKIAAEQTGLPLILDDVAPSWEEEQQYGVGLAQRARDIHRAVTGQARLLVAVSDVIRRLLIEEGQPAGKIITVHNGINDGYFNAGVDGRVWRDHYGLADDTVVIGFVGSFQAYHRVDLLVEAFAQIKTDHATHLLLVGEGKYTPAVKAQVQQLGLTDRVTFTGRIPYTDVAAYTAACDIAVMPATNTYGNPMKVYEYMAMAKPVVAPDQETITELATHQENAYLFPTEDVPALAATLQTLIDDEGLRQRLGQQAAQFAQEHTWDKHAVLLHEAMHKLLV